MSNPVPMTNQELQSYACTACGAEPGQPCMTYGRSRKGPGSHHATQPHQARWDAAHAARNRSLPSVVPAVLRGDPVVAGIVSNMDSDDRNLLEHTLGLDRPDRPEVYEPVYGEPQQRARRVHFIYDARRDPATFGGVMQLWCSCHVFFGADKDRAQEHLEIVNSIPPWIAHLQLDISGALNQAVVNAMLEHDADPTDRDLFIKYRDWVRHALAEAWLDRG